MEGPDLKLILDSMSATQKEKYTALRQRLTGSGHSEEKASYLAIGWPGEDLKKWPPKARYDAAIAERKAKKSGVAARAGMTEREYAMRKILFKLQEWSMKYYSLDRSMAWTGDVGGKNAE